MSLVRILDHMEDEGLLERRASPLDRRARSLYLRAKAKPLEDSIWSISDVTRGEAFAGIASQDMSRFISVFEQIRRNLTEWESPPAASTVVPIAGRERRVRGASSVKRRARRGVKS
jgi:hypothetical protein